MDTFGFDEPLLFNFGSALTASFWGAAVAFAVDAIVSVAVTFVTRPKPVSELEGLVYGTTVDKGDLATPRAGGGRRSSSAVSPWPSPPPSTSPSPDGSYR